MIGPPTHGNFLCFFKSDLAERKRNSDGGRPVPPLALPVLRALSVKSELGTFMLGF